STLHPFPTRRSSDLDRMVSRPPDGRPVSQNAIKMVLYYNDMVFGCTGTARLLDIKGNWRSTDRWLSDVLKTVRTRSLRAALNARSEEHTSELQSRVD